MPLTVTLPHEYDLHAVVERMEGDGDVQFGLISGNTRFIVFLNSTDPRGPVIIGPTSATPFVRLQETRVLTNKVRSNIVIRVRTDGVEVRRDNEAIARYSGPIDELSPIGSSDAAMTDAFIRVYHRTKFHALSVRPAVKSTSDQPSIPSPAPQSPNSATAASALTTVDVAFIGDLFIHAGRRRDRLLGKNILHAGM